MGHCMSCYCFNNEEIQMKIRRENIAKMDNNTIQLDIETFDDETFEEFLKAYEIETKYGVTKLDLSTRSTSSSLLKDISPSIKKIKEENPLENTLENKLKDTLKDVLENTLKDTLKDMFKNTVEISFFMYIILHINGLSCKKSHTYSDTIFNAMSIDRNTH